MTALVRMVSIGLLWLSLAGCGSEAPPAKPAAAPIRVGAYFWPGQYWVDIAHRKGWFREAGLDVQRVDTNADYFSSFDALVEGKLDIVDVTLFDLVLYNAHGKKLVGFLISDHSNGADALVARPGIDSVKALAGKKLGLSKGTYLEYIWTVVAQRAGIRPEAARIVNIPGEKAHLALSAGQVDAILTWEPFAGQAREAVKGRSLFDTSQISGIASAVFSARADFVRERAADLHAFVRVWKKTDEFIRRDPQAAHAIVAEVNRKRPDEVRDMAKLDRALDLRENLAAFSYAGGFDSLYGSARQINDFLIERGMANERIDTAAVFDARFVRALAHAAEAAEAAK